MNVVARRIAAGSPESGQPRDLMQGNGGKADCLLKAAQLLLVDLARGVPITSEKLRCAMEASFGGSDAEGVWVWKDAYEACEAAQVLFLQKYGPAIRRQATSPAALLVLLKRIAMLLPTQTRRSCESQNFQQFSTPIDLGFVAAYAAGLTKTDLVLEPSAGTGLLSVFALGAGASIALNELAEIRADLLECLFPGAPVTRHDAAQIDDRLDAAIRPSVVLMNPPFSVAANVEGKVRDAAFRHLRSAFARLANRGRLVAITGAGLSPEATQWRDAFVRLQERGTIVFSASLDGRAFAAHGTNVETRLIVIDRIAANDPKLFPASPGMAPDAATLLEWVIRDLPPRVRLAAAPAGPSSAPRTAISASLRIPLLATRPCRPCAPQSRASARHSGKNRDRNDRARLRDDRLGARRWRRTVGRDLRRFYAPVDPHRRRGAAPDAAGAVGRHGLGHAAQA